ncbi:uncharacterized protein EV420DRAFT_1564523 [Desarmillaria tabescens]|uniref:Uncharacterized protein n=1 Tax=Armillaria tabescens TaxID=1929756 RepID=A0AA39MXJ5_ARMTA|nr:uncharacterized protein EV420DRAFT_1564523 [Desarmillaria tabescens]KAK0449540.1 hypothetical protein EV420DRAFT_1564523 [Desarmillaria tabescens]
MSFLCPRWNVGFVTLTVSHIVCCSQVSLFVHRPPTSISLATLPSTCMLHWISSSVTFPATLVVGLDSLQNANDTKFCGVVLLSHWFVFIPLSSCLIFARRLTKHIYTQRSSFSSHLLQK